MEDRAKTPTDDENVVPLRTASAAPGPDLDELVEQAFRVGLGLASAGAAILSSAITRTLGHEPAPFDEGAAEDEEALRLSGIPILAGAALGLTLESGRWALRTATSVANTARPWVSLALSPNIVRRRVDRTWATLRVWDERWQDGAPTNEAAATAFVKGLVPEVVDAVLDQLDLTELVLERVDLDRVAEHLDVDAVVERVDLERAIGRIDLDEIVARIDVGRIIDRVDLDGVVDRVDIERIIERVDLRAIVDRLPLDEIVARIDVDEIVARVDLDRVLDRVDIERIVDRVDLNKIAERIDVDAVAARMDLDAVVARMDLVGIARYVIDELDLPEIIRGSTGTMATETVEGIRIQGMSADRLVSRLVDRALHRRGERDMEPLPEQEDEP